MKRKSFIIHIDSLVILDDLTNEQAGMLFKAIKSYQSDSEIELDPIIKIAFSPFKNQFIRDEDKYLLTCKRRADAGSKGGIAKASKIKQKLANASKSKQNLANLADSDSKSKNDSDSDSKSETNKRFTPPTREEVIQHCTEKRITVNVDKFLNHYESNGWRVGKNKMKSWKATLSNWGIRDAEDRQGTINGSSGKTNRTLSGNELIQQSRQAAADWLRSQGMDEESHEQDDDTLDGTFELIR